ncbi:MAG: PRD domain-containing protein [Erysipelotrichaceae bacterium]|nr:PRD domain-containing protein [Erysipelotrichaceae bacterium]
MNERLVISTIDTAIIEYLILNHDYCDSYDIARNVGINRRQVRSAIVSVKNILHGLGFTLESKRSKGYRIVERNRIGELSDIIHASTPESSSFISPLGRQDCIMEILFMRDNEYTQLDELADLLYVSRSSIANDIADLKSQFDKRKVAIETKSRQGIRMIGEEFNKRECYCDCLFNILTKNNIHYAFLDLFLDEKNPLEFDIIRTIRSFQIPISDYALCDFLLYLTVSVMRIMQGKCLTDSPDIQNIKQTKEYELAIVLATKIGQYFGFYANEHEINRIAIKLIAKESASIQERIIPSSLAVSIGEETIKRIYDRTGVLLPEDDPLYPAFMRSVETGISYLKYNEKVRNPFFDSIKENCPLAYQMSLIYQEVMAEIYHKKPSTSDLVFCSIFFNNWIQKLYHHPRKVLLVCGLGSSATQMTCSLLNEALYNSIQITDTRMYYELSDCDLSRFDFVISTMAIQKELPIPAIHISQFVTRDDVRRVQNYISNDYQNLHPEYVCVPTLFTNIPENVTSLKECFKIMSEMVCRQFSRLKINYVDSQLNNKTNIHTVLDNGIYFLRLEKPLISGHYPIIALLSNPIIIEEKLVYAVIVVSSDHSDYQFYRSLRELVRLIPAEKIQKISREKGDYAALMRLFIETKNTAK